MASSRKRLTAVMETALRIADKHGAAKWDDGLCECGHAYDEHKYSPKCEGSMECKHCSCINYKEHVKPHALAPSHDNND